MLSKLEKVDILLFMRPFVKKKNSSYLGIIQFCTTQAKLIS